LLLPNIISKPYQLAGAVNETDAQMTEIERTVRGVLAVAQPAIATPSTSADSQTPRQVRPQPKKRKQHLTADQVTQLKLAFSRVDANGDGDISKSEIMSAVAKSSDLCDLLGLDLHPNASVEERMFEAGVLFKDMDTDGNSTIDEGEFVAFFGILASDDVEAPAATNVDVTLTEHADNEHKHSERLVPGTSEQDADARP
jgi:hypothetical protein